MNREFWRGRKVFLTGHTGFKGSWLTLWLKRLGANVSGYSLPPNTTPSLFEAADVRDGIRSTFADVRDLSSLSAAMTTAAPEVVLHLAAQSLVRESYRQPVETYATNVMGAVNLLEAVRSCPSVRSVVVVTSDKCYENREWLWPYREDEPLGGRDPYSSSKACAELVTAAYRHSFFGEQSLAGIATARAGNVVGGGDWAGDRLVPDLIAAFAAGRPAQIRNPSAVRPWQHVLDPLHGYLLLAEALAEDRGIARGWNFGPPEVDARPVSWIADELSGLWGEGATWSREVQPQPHEANSLKLDSSMARTLLGWSPRLDLRGAMHWIVEWHRGFALAPENARAVTMDQIERFEALA
jgi:CDP-glucose 4,6-dehydratase